MQTDPVKAALVEGFVDGLGECNVLLLAKCLKLQGNPRQAVIAYYAAVL